VESAADRAAWGIRALIVSGAYGVGDRLPAERDLAAELKLSRPALREGIRRLRSGGVLESRRGSGTYVAQVDIGGLFDLRIRVEPLAAERAAKLRDEADLANMSEALESMRACLDDPAAYDLADLRFHSSVTQASRSPVLVSTLDMITELGLLVRAATSTSRRLRVSALTDVERILATVERKHPKRAANAMERHIINIRASYDARTEAENRFGAVRTG
jgi:DNA-binding FadR family transcriptional regulator